ncbi:MAG: HlyD family type I secretion periplasmic adaptor subunit [Gammaproteobacteria bacterium]|nr:HlyD family type I secretion periplasmic adaptor subunit [Gammaproteobacteria bacterium]
MKLIANPDPKANPDGLLQSITSMEAPRRAGLLLFALVFGVFGLWAALAPIDSAAYAPGSVTVRSYKKVVQHLEGGIVQDILARDGDLVDLGQPILILDDTQASAQLEITNAQFIALKAREARLIAERDGLEEVEYSASFSQSDPRGQQEIKAQNEIFEARKTANQGRYDILLQRIEQLENQSEGMRALRESKELLATSYSEELEDTRILLEQGFSEVTRLREIERNFAAYSGETAELTSQIAANEVQIGETRLQILQQESEFRNEVVNELGDTQTSLQDVTERITALEDIVSRTVVKAPDTGIINGMQVHTIGGVIGPGSAIAEVVPESDELIVEASVNPVDIDSVAEGQEARIRFSTFGSSAPTIFGTLLTISADRVVDENTGVGYYLARVEVDPDSLDSLGDQALLPGMPAEVFINTGSQTFLQYLFKPLSNTVVHSFNEN